MPNSPSRARLNRREALLAIGGLALLAANTGASAAPAATRRLNLRHAHTGEAFAGPYRDAAGPIPEAMADLSIFLRDHRVNQVGPLDIRLLDFLADLLAAADHTQATVLSGYRTSSTNRLLSAAGFGVAERSAHLRGHALDVAFPTRLEATTAAARAMRRGGVGFYPRSGFLHLDIGPVRNWNFDGAGQDTALAAFRPAGPLTVRDRMKLHRRLARQQWLRRRAG